MQRDAPYGVYLDAAGLGLAWPGLAGLGEARHGEGSMTKGEGDDE